MSVTIKNLSKSFSAQGDQHTAVHEVSFEVEEGTNRVVIIAAIDNLMKGAAGSAVAATIEGLRPITKSLSMLIKTAISLYLLFFFG